MSDAKNQISVHSTFKNPFSLLSSPEQFHRVELLNYTNANGEELVGLAVELTEDPPVAASKYGYLGIQMSLAAYQWTP